MKIAYLMHSYREFDELIETINQLVKQGDHVFVMINNNDLRDKIYFVYAESQNVHVSFTQDFAQVGDLSLARGTIIQMKEAMERTDFDYFINLTDGMMPIKTRDEIVAFLEKEHTDHFYVKEDETQNPALKKQMKQYYPLTNLISFPTGTVARNVAKASGNIFSFFGLRRKTEDKVFIGSPYFMIKKESAKILVNHFDYVSEIFKLSWYAEEMYIPMMFDKFNIGPHNNCDYRVIGPQGQWIASSGSDIVTAELIDKNPDAFFAGKILSEEDVSLYENYFDRYNQ